MQLQVPNASSDEVLTDENAQRRHDWDQYLKGFSKEDTTADKSHTQDRIYYGGDNADAFDGSPGLLGWVLWAMSCGYCFGMFSRRQGSITQSPV
jgi:hypothetical protein